MARSDGLIGQTVRLTDLRTRGRDLGRWREVPRLTFDAFRVSWRASRREVILTLGLQTLAGGGMTVQLLAAQRVLQHLLTLNSPGGSASELVLPFAVLTGAMVVMGAFTALSEQHQRLLGELVAQHTLAQIIDVSTRVEMAAFEDPAFHDHLERARTSAITRSVQVVSSASSMTFNLLSSAGIGIALLLLEPLLVPLVIVSAIPLLASTVSNSRRAYNFEWAMTAKNRERAYLVELLSRREAAAEVRVFGATGFLRTRYEALTRERLRRMREYLRERLWVALAGSIATTVGMGLALAALAVLIASGRIPVATALTAGAAMQQLSSRIFGLMTGLGQLVESGMFVDDYNSFLRILPPALEEGAAQNGNGNGNRNGSAPPALFNGLSVSDVAFKYPGTENPVLDGVSMRVDPGEVVALVGENGSGKTTLVKLICQLYAPESGSIAWLGPEGREIDPEEVRDETTVLFQDFLHYYLTATDNIALGRVDRHPSEDAVHGAASEAGAHGFLSSLPSGYETRLGRQFQDGHDLSLGQWQRLALARAFFRGGGFLVLDEPTASLDPKGEYELFQQMRRLWRGRSVLLVSHRFSSVRAADRIYVLQGGRVHEEGSHADLMAKGGHYSELFTLQAAAYLGKQDLESEPEQKKAFAEDVLRP